MAGAMEEALGTAPGWLRDHTTGTMVVYVSNRLTVAAALVERLPADARVQRYGSGGESGDGRVYNPPPPVCCIRGVWVVAGRRRQGLAARVLDAARGALIPGYIASRGEVAFSQPTVAGAKLAAAYCGREAFAVYTT